MKNNKKGKSVESSAAPWGFLSMHWAGAMLFIVNIWPSYMFYNLNTHKIFMAQLGMLFLCMLEMVYFFLILKKRPDYQTWHFKTIAALLLITLASFPGMLWHHATYNYYFPIEFTANVVSIIFAFMVIRRTRSLADLKVFFLWCGALIVYSTIIALIEKGGLFIFEWRTLDVVDRPVSVHGNPAYYAGLLSLLLTFFLFYVVQKIPVFWRSQDKNERRDFFLFATILAFGLVSFILLKTRATLMAMLIAFFLGLAFYLIIHRHVLTRRQQMTVVGGVIAFFALVAVIDFALGFPFWKRIETLSVGSVWAPRLNPWLTAIASIKDSPWIGFGLGSSYSLFFEYVRPDIRFVTEERSYSHAHNELLEMTQEGGLLVVVVFAILWLLIVRNLWRVIFKNEAGSEARTIGISLLFAFVAYHINSLGCVSARMMSLKFPLYAFMGISFALYYLTVKKDEQKPVSPRFSPVVFIMPALILLTSYIIFPWCSSMKEFTTFLKNPNKSPAEVRHFEEAIERHPNVYAAESLARAYYMNGMWSKALQWLEEANRLVPYFRETAYFKGEVLQRLGQWEQAKAQVLAYQQKDYYYLPAISFLMGVAVKEGNYQLYREQIVYLAKKLITERDVYRGTPFADEVVVVFHSDPSGPPVSITLDENSSTAKMKIVFSEEKMRFAFASSLECWQQGKDCAMDEMNKKISQFFNQIMQDKFFHKQFKHPLDQGTNQRVDQMLGSYFKILNAEQQLTLQQEKETYELMKAPLRPQEKEWRIREIASKYKRLTEENDSIRQRAMGELEEYIYLRNFVVRFRFATNYSEMLFKEGLRRNL